MSSPDLLSFLGLAVMCTGVAVLALLAAARFDDGQRRRALLAGLAADAQVVFLFDADRLVHATPEARAILNNAPRGMTDRARLLAVLQPRFPDLAGVMRPPDGGKPVRIDAEDGTAILTVAWRNSLARITLDRHNAEDQPVHIDRHSLAALEAELAVLRETVAHLPYPLWRETRDGTITWANQSYLSLADRVAGDASAKLIWPPAKLIDTAGLHDLSGPRRRELKLPGRDGTIRQHWLDCRAVALGNEHLFVATPADAVVKAQTDLSAFVQTLTRTFAHLPTGLAVFDRQRQLILFNPALTDLTGLPASFLIGRPTLGALLDRLRERHLILKPADSGIWRAQLLAAGVSPDAPGHSERWELHDGRIFQICTEPHPGGGLALLMQDISNEVARARQHRDTLLTWAAALDAMDEAVVLFAPDGTATFTNDAYRTLWGSDPRATTANATSASYLWHEKCVPSPIWGDFRAFVGDGDARAEWNGEARLWDGRRLMCRFVPLVGAMTLVSFTLREGAPPRFQPQDGSGDKRRLDA